MNFSALILAGGQSSRMGRDKAWLGMDGETLLARQVKLVRQGGAQAIWLSGRSDTNYSALGCPVLTDKFAGAGPLAGIERGLAITTSPLLLVLAVDLPAMNASFLKWLTEVCADHLGVIPRLGGQIEPLAAVYPKAAAAIAETCLRDGQNAAGNFARLCVAAGLAQFKAVPVDQASCLANWNYPGDFAAGVGGGQTGAGQGNH